MVLWTNALAVPYLNGGLFEKAEDGTDALAESSLPDRRLPLSLIPRRVCSLVTTLRSESTPLEIDVAVDPEMLGKVFEELVTGRHEQGAITRPSRLSPSWGAPQWLNTCSTPVLPKVGNPLRLSFEHDLQA